MARATIIAEGGVNHNKSLATALKLVDAAKECGADVFKTQLEIPNTKTDYTLTYDETLKVYAHCLNIGIPFACTAFDVPTLEFLLANCDMPFVKIASCDLMNTPLIEACKASGLPIIQSVPEDAMLPIAPWTMLHVVAEYPTPIEHCRISRLLKIGLTGCDYGISDHSGDPLIGIAAAVLGSKIIECHLTLNRNQEGPDHTSSLAPYQFKFMVDGVRTLERAF